MHTAPEQTNQTFVLVDASVNPTTHRLGHVVPEQLLEANCRLAALPKVVECAIVPGDGRMQLLLYSPPELDCSSSIRSCFSADRAGNGISHCAWHGPDAIRHLFEMASGLNTLAPGDPAVVERLKQAHSTARAAGTLYSQLGSLLSGAIRAAKRVRRAAQRDTRQAQLLLQAEVARYQSRYTTRVAGRPALSLQLELERIRTAEMRRFRVRLGELTTAQEAALETLTRRIVADVLRTPIELLQEAARRPDGIELERFICTLFNVGSQILPEAPLRALPASRSE